MAPMTNHRLRLFLAALLIISGVIFAVGSAIERSQAHESVQPSAESTPTSTEGGSGEGSSGETGTTVATPHVEATVSSETLFGINPESTGLVAIAILVSLLLAAGVWFWGHRPVLIAALVFGVVFTALDLREAIHQTHESRTGLVVLAIVLAALHGAVGSLAFVALLHREPAPAAA